MVTDETAVPADYKTAGVEMPAPVWESIARRDGTVIGKLTMQNLKLKVRLADVKKAIKASDGVAGADLEFPTISSESEACPESPSLARRRSRRAESLAASDSRGRLLSQTGFPWTATVSI